MKKREEEQKVLDVNASMQGNLVFADPVNLRINGRFDGSLKTRGQLIIGEKAEVFANIEGDLIIVSGYVKGTIKAKEKLIITSSGNIEGKVFMPILRIEEGGILNGYCKMREDRLTLKELSEYISVEEDKIKQWVNQGSIPVLKEGDEILFDLNQVEDWLNKSVVK